MSKRHLLLSLLLILPVFQLILFQSALATQIRIAWVASSGATGYEVYYGTASNTYGLSIDVGNVTTCTLNDLSSGQTYFIAVKAYNNFGKSGYSNEVSGFSTGPAEIIGTWSSGIRYYNVAASNWTKMYEYVPSGPIAVGDVTGDGKADVISCWPSGLWYQNGATLGWTKVYYIAPDKVAAGDITGD